MKRELKTKLTYECRCNERIKTKVEESTRLRTTITAQWSYPFLGHRIGLSVRRSPRSFSYTFHFGWRMVGFDHPHNPLRMTDRLVRTPSVKEKRKRFLPHNGGARRAKVSTPSHHKDRATVHGLVETEDTKGSTWISKDTWWITRTQGICRPASVMWSVEKTLVVEGDCCQRSNSSEHLSVFYFPLAKCMSYD